MGKSKFPGKPSKLVNKKRISVLQNNSFDEYVETSKVQWFDKNCESQSPNFVVSNDGQKIQKIPSKLPASEPPDGGGSGGIGSSCSDKGEDEDTNRIKNKSITTQKSRNIESHNSISNLSNNKNTDITNNNDVTNSNSSNNNSNSNTNKGTKSIELSKKDKNIKDKTATIATTTTTSALLLPEKPVKKKTVTFKNILETSDDACAVKKVYNPDNAPLVPIIKRECLSRSVRLARSDCIVRPSRLTEILKNNANNIDKLNSLKFKSASSSTSSVASINKNSSNNNNNSNSNSSKLNSSKSSFHDDHSDILNNSNNCNSSNSNISKNSSNNKNNTINNNNNNNNNINISNNNNNINGNGLINDGKKDKSDNNNIISVPTSRLDKIIVDGDKRFVLPKRSNNSCRVIKPNKRFLNDNVVYDASSKHHVNKQNQQQQQQRQQQEQEQKQEQQEQNHKNSTSVTTNSSLKLNHNNDNDNNNNDDNNNSDDDSNDDDDDDDDDNVNDDKKYPNESDDSDEDSIENKNHHQEYQKPEGVKLTRSILKFNTKKLLSDNDDEIGIQSTSNKLNKQDGLNSTDSLEEIKLNPFVSTRSINSALLKNSNKFLFNTMSSSKGILRQPRLQFSETQNLVKEQKNSLSGITGFSSNLSGNMGAFQQNCNNGNCGICLTPINSKNLADSRKYGIQCCDICRKFISKITKRSIASIGTSPNVLQCNRGDGTCVVTPLLKASLKNFKKTYKERCSACWLKKCIKNCHFSSGHKNRLKSVLPTSFVEDINNSDKKSALNTSKPKELGVSNSAFSNVNIDGNVKKLLDKFKNNRSSNTISSNLFANTTNTKLINWNTSSSSSENLFENSGNNGSNNNHRSSIILSLNNNGIDDIKSLSTSSTSSLSSNENVPTKSLSLSNPLSENNTKFGGLPKIKPTVLEKPIIMVDSISKNEELHLHVENKVIINSGENISTTQESNKLLLENENNTKIKLRKKDKIVEQSALTTPSQQTSITPSITISSEPKRQRIDLKGPRVKHVCRSASIVLGQTIATFPEDAGSILENMETPPRPESPNNAEVELPNNLRDNCTTCSHPEEQDLGLSPPATPTELEEKVEETLKVSQFDSSDISKDLISDAVINNNNDSKNKNNKLSTKSENSKIDHIDDFNMDTSENSQDFVRDSVENVLIKNECTMDEFSCEGDSTNETSGYDKENSNENLIKDKKIKLEEFSKSSKRKISRQGTHSYYQSNHTKALLPVVNLGGRNLNVFSKKFSKEFIDIKEELHNTVRISIDFWENYDPAEVSQNGFGIIVTEAVPMRALCFLCGSSGIDGMVFCACCCEPYHQYCVADEYNFKHSSLDETMTNLLDTSINPIENMNLITNRLNWLCPRCTVCYTCNMTSGSKVKCQKCQKYYHTTCLGTSKRLLGADRPLICASCLKCKSCGTTKVSKFVGNLPMCSQCFKLRKKGNFCPICQKCYEENDFDLKMMECGDCQRWVHAKCEGLSDEQYNLLSTLPENIEFVCKKCTYKNVEIKKSEWRDAVSAEFKSGLLSVVKLLSKSRQACALLKLSPRKKCSFTCVCQNQNAVRNLLFNKNTIQNNTARSIINKENEEISQCSEDIQNDIYEFTESSNSPIPGGTSYTKCVCSASRMKLSPALSLVDIKNKINSCNYVSLAEFNYDMENVITTSNCDELMLTYKEILSETFPWFQNETKACTDALEEDMFDACNFSQHSDDCLDGIVTDGGVNSDNQVPEINLPDDVDDCIYSQHLDNDERMCLFCKGTGESDPDKESRLLYCGHNSWVHINCAMWSAEVFEEIDGSLQNVHSAISRGRMIKCTVCGNRGATVGCNVKSCGEHYHYPCARKIECAFMTDKTVYCPEHLEYANRKKCTNEYNFEVNRPVYVELDRRKKKMVEPTKVNFLIGSLQVKNLGRVFPKFSDTNEAIIPVDFHCTRLYWSMKEPWKIVQYTIKTSIQSNIFSFNSNGDVNRNFTVDHTGNLNMVQIGLSQIARWHNSLLQNYDETDRSTVKQFLEAVGQNLCSADETTTEEEPQNNADLLPPEIKDAIFEDLPHELLDGISMLDIFPKLMVYEDIHSVDFKPENLLVNELSRDNNNDYMSDVDKDCNNSNKELVENSWSIGQVGINHVEDALLSAVRPLSGMVGREIKRSKSEVLARNASRSQQRSSSLTWSCKLDNNAIKRRKISKGFQDLRLPEGVLLSLGRRKEEYPVRRGSQTDESNKSKTFTWSAAKKYCQENLLSGISATKDNLSEKFKISQLDGMDDPMMTEETTTTEFRIYDPNSIGCPVKCDRCQCTYRTQESFQRHLIQCEPLSTSESESETARTPESDTSVQQNILLDFNKGPHHGSGTFIQNLNHAFPITTNTNPNILGRQSTTNVQITPLRGQASIQIQNNSVPITHINQTSIPNIFLNTQQAQHNLNQPSQSALGQQFISSIQNLNQFQNNSNNIPTIQMSLDSNGQQIFTIATNTQQQQQQQLQHQHQHQHHHHQQHLQTHIPQANIITTNVINLDKQQKKPKLSPRPTQFATKIKPQKSMMSPKLKKISPQQTTTTATIQGQNQIPIFRNQTQNETQKPIIIQQSAQNPNTQPIILQQVTNAAPQNIVTYIDNNNQLQYLAMPSATTDFKQPQQPYITTTNPLVQGNTYLQTDVSGNLVLTNGAPGLQMISAGPTLQLTQQQHQPQVIGTLIQPAQCGVMSTDQMVLGTPGNSTTLDVMGNPTMLLTTTGTQPMYYGLETIVQNTVMSSQQFVSTAMQGVLSQNSSFSATTTQVFQASKIEPIVELPGGYVVLNNVDGMIQQPNNQQTNISTNLIQQPTIVQQIQPQQMHTSQPIQQVQQVYNVQQQNQPTTIIQNPQPQQSNTSQTITITQPNRNQQISINAIQPQMRPASPIKPTAKSSPLIVKKIQPHIANQISNTNPHQTQQSQNINTQMINSTQGIIPTSLSTLESMNPIIITTANLDTNNTMKPLKTPISTNQQILKPKLTTITSNSTVQRKTNLIKPLNKVASAPIKPKVVSKPVSPKVVVKNVPTTPQLIAPKPTPAHLTNLVTNPVENNRIEITLANTPDTNKNIHDNSNVNSNLQNINKNIEDYIKAQNECSPSVSEVPTTILTFSSDGELTSNISTNHLNSQCYEINCSTSGSIGLAQNNSIYTTANNNLISSPLPQSSLPQQQAQSITLPITTTTTSIQLPSAPFVSPFGNNIPTNIVNPIPQVSSSNQIISRPTNRVLPMQTMLQKSTTAIPTASPTEQKIIKNENAPDKIPFLNENKVFKDPIREEFRENPEIGNNFELIEKTNFENDIVDNALESDIFMENADSTDKEDKIMEKPDLALENSAGNDAFDFISRIHMEAENSPKSCQDVSDNISESTAPEVKEKISEILENLENDDCKGSSPNISEHFEEDEIVDDSDVIEDNKSFIDQKENITPNIPQANNVESYQVSNGISKNIDLQNYQKGPKILYEIQSEDGFIYKSTSIIDVWEKVFEAVQMARKAHGLAPLPEGPVADMCGIQMLGLKTNALRYLIEQLPGVERCTKYTTKYHKRELNTVDYSSDSEEYKESIHGSARCEQFMKRSDYDMFGWLASRHRKQPIQVVVQPTENECVQRRGTGSNLPMAMKYRTLKETYKDYIGVFRSHIHGRGLYCTKDIEAGEMVIEYAGELIRSTLTDKRERYYDGKGIGCYMFKIDDNLVVDATMRGNAARFINHSCEPNCYSKVVDILGHKHIIIFALRRIVQGEELTYDYKFPFEDVKIPCSCGSKKCRKYLN